MEASERDSTGDWLLPEGSRPPLLSELEARIDEALSTARASEAAAVSVGAAALDAAEQARRAAEQARRAAEQAERASAAVLGAAPPGPARPEPPTSPVAGGREEAEYAERSGDGEEGLRDFSARADRIAARLRRLEQTPLPAV